MKGRMPDRELEQAYDLIAEAIDRAGRGQEAEFLARLCLALAAQLDNVSQVKTAIDAAEKADRQ
jgi:hypothetical protein